MPLEFTNKLVFEDVDVLGETIRTWDLEIHQLEGGSFRGLIAQVARDGWIAGRAEFSQATGQNGLSPAGMRTVVIAGTQACTLFWRNHRIGGNEMMIFPSNRELDAVGYKDFRVLTLSFRQEELAAQFRGLGVALPDDILDQAEVLQIDPSDMLPFRRRLQLITNIPGWLENKEVSLPNPLKLLAQSLAGALGVKMPNNIRKRDLALVQAVEVLRSDHLGQIPIHTLSRRFGVSRRTLDTVFKKEIGLTPGAYRKNIRLNNVHRLLHRADPHVDCVKDIARSIGFEHLGQFAKDYRAFFGMLPSEALRFDIDS
ncbi:MAG: AraC family transcriptional regulator [Deltaproteobacteria bacterium]|nr:AraC family transcriptional regulator [Deltaproteobacteria bacterium]